MVVDVDVVVDRHSVITETYDQVVHCNEMGRSEPSTSTSKSRSKSTTPDGDFGFRHHFEAETN